VLFLVTSGTGLQGVYGQSGYDTVLRKLNTIAKLDATTTLRILDDANSMQDGSQAKSLDANALYGSLKSISGAINNSDSILIVGDQRVFPSFQIPNPVTDRNIDPDIAVVTDNPYGDFSGQQPADCTQPTLAVGRIATGVSDSAQDLCNLLDWQILFRQRRPQRYGYVEVTSRQWQDTSSFILSALTPSQRVFISPDSRISASNASSFDCKYLYCNLHGFIDRAEWMGFDQGLSAPVPAITPDAFQPEYVSGTVVFTEACYGLATSGKVRSSSCALSLLAAGAGAIIGSTGLAYGTATVAPQNLIDADAMAGGFFNNALTAGKSVGDCIKAARRQLSRGTSSTDVFVKKTLLEFQLLGDPSYAAS
jgi:Peptidase family C25